MMKHLWLYPLIFGIMLAGILGCMIRIGWMLWEMNEGRVHTGAQLVMEAVEYAQI